MKTWLAQIALVFAFLLTTPAQAQTQWAGQGLPVTDPAAYARAISNEVSRDRMEPIRRAMRQMLDQQELSTELEITVTQMDRYLGNVSGVETVKLEDVSLAGTLRRIYYLNSFPGRFLFTRYDFIRSSDGWVLTGITFGSTWNIVNANPVTPGWTVTQ